MKYAIPEISWHNRDPVLSVDFQPRTSPNDPLRLASGGTDSHVLIWHISLTESGSVDLEVAADLTRHQKAVNVVRWSRSGQLLASGDDESIIFVWKLNSEKEPALNNMEQDEVYKESWTIFKTLRGHMEDVLDLSWSPDSTQLVSGSVDNKLIVWDINRGKYTSILSDHKGFVQGVAWDPKGQLIASASSDRVFRTFDVSTKKVVSRSSKAVLPVPEGHPLHNTTVRLYHDDTLQTFYRRLQWSPDGLLVAVPGGRAEPEGRDAKPLNAVYVYTRYCLKEPACVLPTESPPLVVRWAPSLYQLRSRGPKAAFPFSYRAILAVATRGSVILYDTQQKAPLGLLSNIHYTRLTDLAWSPDGRALVASSTDGFCSVLTFAQGELGELAEEPMDIQEDQKPEPLKPETPKQETKEKEEPKINRLDSFIKFKAPEKSPKKNQKIYQKMDKTPVKLDVLEEVAMPSWSDNSNNEILKPKDCPVTIELEDSEDFKLVYEDTEETEVNNAESPDKQNLETTEKDKKTIEKVIATREKDKKSEERQKFTKDSSKASKKSSPPVSSCFTIELEDSEDFKLVYDDTEVNNAESPDKKNLETTEKDKETIEKVIETRENAKKSPERQKFTKESPKASEKTSPPESGFFKRAKVTDSTEGAAKAVSSPKAPRRVAFVTLSSPKNSKKKC